MDWGLGARHGVLPDESLVILSHITSRFDATLPFLLQKPSAQGISNSPATKSATRLPHCGADTHHFRQKILRQTLFSRQQKKRHATVSVPESTHQTAAVKIIDLSIDSDYRFFYYLPISALPHPMSCRHPGDTMNALTNILEHLKAIDQDLQELLQAPMQIETARQRLELARSELITRCGGTDALQGMHNMAVADLYAGQADGHSLD